MTTGITCPECGTADHGITDSRPSGTGTRRRRKCVAGHTFSTLELPVNYMSRLPNGQRHARLAEAAALLKKGV